MGHYQTYDDKFPVWEGLTTQAQLAWHHGESNLGDMLGRWSRPHASAYVLTQLHTQVTDGGFIMWYANRYIICYNMLIDVLDRIQSEKSAKVKHVLKQAITTIKDCDEAQRKIYDTDDSQKNDRHVLHNECVEALELLDAEYHLICEKGFMDEVERFFAMEVLQRVNSMVVGL